MTHDLTSRARLTQLTLNAFNDRPFAWGSCDCARLVDFHISQFGKSSTYAQTKAYATEAGAYKALRKRGFADTADWLDSIGLTRLPGAAHAMVGDIIGFSLPGSGMTGLSVVVGHGRILGFHQLIGSAVVQVLDLTIPNLTAIAWRI